jgi:hypothetical protein
MHAVVTRVTINDRPAAEAFLREQLVPKISGAPGFVAGYWMNIGGDKGSSVWVFESEEAAQAAASQDRPPEGGPVTIDSIEVGEVVAHA